MAQEYVKINGVVICQPDEGLGYDFETTYTADTTRTQDGVLHPSAMFTVESLSYTATNISSADAKSILQYIAKGQPFTLHYFSPYYGVWRDDSFYVGRGNLSIKRLNTASETFDSLSFQMTGVHPI